MTKVVDLMKPLYPNTYDIRRWGVGNKVSASKIENTVIDTPMSTRNPLKIVFKGNSEAQGTYFHPHLAIHVFEWLNP